MNECIKISVCITTFDRIEMLRDAILSVLSQKYSNIELLVGNDNPLRVIDADSLGLYDSRIIWQNNTIQLGYIGNYNSLLQCATGSYFISLSDDDKFHPLLLSTLVGLINNCDVVAAYSSYQSNDKFFATPLENFTHAQYLHDEWTSSLLGNLIKIQGCYGLVRTDIIRDLGGSKALGSDPSFSPYNDLLLAIEISAYGSIVFINKPLIYYRLHKGSESYTSVDYNAYLTAQQDFFRYVSSLIPTDQIPLLQDRFLNDFLHVIERSRNVQCSDYVAFYKASKRSGLFNTNNTLFIIKKFPRIIRIFIRSLLETLS